MFDPQDKVQWEKAVLKVVAEIGKVTKELRASSFENVESRRLLKRKRNPSPRGLTKS